jgi:hypothetical protein
MTQPIDLVDEGNCQADMRSGMMQGDARLPPKLRRAQEQQARAAVTQALADALRRRATEETTIETTAEDANYTISDSRHASVTATPEASE